MCQKPRRIAVALTSEVTAPQSDDVLDPETLNLYLKARQLYTGNDSSFSITASSFGTSPRPKPNSPLLLVGYAKACARAWFETFGRRAQGDSRCQQTVESRKTKNRPFGAWCGLLWNRRSAGERSRRCAKALGLRLSLPIVTTCSGESCASVVRCRKPSHTWKPQSRLDPLSTRPRLEMVRLFAMTGAWKQVDSLLQQELNDPRAVPLWWMITGRMALWRKDPAWAKQKRRCQGMNRWAASVANDCCASPPVKMGRPR